MQYGVKKVSVRVFIDNIDVTNKIISYTRSGDICDGEESIELRCFPDIQPFTPWKEIKLYENGNLVQIYYVDEFSIEHDVAYIRGQSGVKWLRDYFIAEQFTLRGETSRYWIDRIATMAGMVANFLHNQQGHNLYENMSLGMQSAYEAIMQLCKINGWYFWAKGQNLYIGSLEDFQQEGSVEWARVLEYTFEEDDEHMRNRAVVWGSYQEGQGWVFADKSVETPYDIDFNDKRTTVLANSLIPDFATAYNIADLMLATFARRIVKKKFTIEGFVDVALGKFFYVGEYGGVLFRYTVEVDFDTGAVSELQLEGFCPRMFYYFYRWIPFSGYYVSVSGHGVWRKDFGTLIWSGYNKGLPSGAVVVDLKYAIDELVCVEQTTSGGYVSSERNGEWKRLVNNALASDLNSEEFIFGAVVSSVNISGSLFKANPSGFTTSGTVVDYVCTPSGTFPLVAINIYDRFHNLREQIAIPSGLYIHEQGRKIADPYCVVRSYKPFNAYGFIPGLSPIGDYTFHDAIVYNNLRTNELQRHIRPASMVITYFEQDMNKFSGDVLMPYGYFTYNVSTDIPPEWFPISMTPKKIFGYNGRVLAVAGRAKPKPGNLIEIVIELLSINVVTNHIENKREFSLGNFVYFGPNSPWGEFWAGAIGFNNGFVDVAVFYSIIIDSSTKTSGEIRVRFPSLRDSTKTVSLLSPYYGTTESAIHVGNGLSIYCPYDYQDSFGTVYSMVGFHDNLNDFTVMETITPSTIINYSVTDCEFGGNLVALSDGGSNLKIFNNVGVRTNYTFSGSVVCIIQDFRVGFIIVLSDSSMYVANLAQLYKLSNIFPYPLAGLENSGGYDVYNKANVFRINDTFYLYDLLTDTFITSRTVSTSPLYQTMPYFIYYSWTDKEGFIRTVSPVSRIIAGMDLLYNFRRRKIERILPLNSSIESRKIVSNIYTVGSGAFHRYYDVRDFIGASGYGLLWSNSGATYVNDIIIHSGMAMVGTFSMNDLGKEYPNFIVATAGDIIEFEGVLSGINRTGNLPSGQILVVRTNDYV